MPAYVSLNRCKCKGLAAAFYKDKAHIGTCKIDLLSIYISNIIKHHLSTCQVLGLKILASLLFNTIKKKIKAKRTQ